MNDLSDVMMKLKDAIESLQSREPDLTPLEKLKLKALRLNLHIVQGEATSVVAMCPRESGEQATLASLEEKLSRLSAVSQETRAKTRLLLREARTHIAHGRLLCDAISLAVAHNELGYRQLSNAHADVSSRKIPAFAVN